MKRKGGINYRRWYGYWQDQDAVDAGNAVHVEYEMHFVMIWNECRLKFTPIWHPGWHIEIERDTPEMRRLRQRRLQIFISKTSKVILFGGARCEGKVKFRKRRRI